MVSISKEQIDISSITLSQVREFVDFHNSYYGTERKPEHWIWQYKNYEPDKVVFTTARHNGKLIGTQAMMPVYMRIGEQCILTGKSENTLLLPEYRGKKVMKELYKYAIDLCQDRGFEFIWGFTPAINVFRKFGFFVYPVPLIFCRLGLNFVASAASRFRKPNPFWRKIAAMGGYSFFYLKNIRHIGVPFLQQQPDYQISKEIIEISQINELQNKLHMKHKAIMSVLLDEKYIAWRIRSHSFLKYQEYQVLRKGELQAFAFVVFNQGTVSISCLLSLDEHATSILIYRIIKDNITKTGQFNILINPKYTRGQNTTQVLSKFGFCSNSTMNLVVKDLSQKNHEIITKVGNWNITGLWTEGYSM